MNRIRPLVAIGIALTAVAVWVVPGVSPDKGELTAPPSVELPAVSTAGYVVHIDPATGRLASTPQGTAPAMFDEEMRNRLSTSSEGLVEKPSPVPGGGTMVDLQGRFQNAFVAAVNDSGRVEATCVAKPEKAAGEGGDGR
jgi:hypothetical protein